MHQNTTKEEVMVSYTQEALKEAKCIVFSADISNEEAILLQAFRNTKATKLVCPEAKAYQQFLEAYSNCSGYHVFRGRLDALATSDLVISFGMWMEDEKADSMVHICQMLKEKKSNLVYMHPIEDKFFTSEITQFIKYEAGSEEGVAALLVQTLLQNQQLPTELEVLLDAFDIGYLSAESNVGEEELEQLYAYIDEKSVVTLLVGSDIYTHSKAKQIGKLLGLLERYGHINVLCVPPASNALGVALVCELDDGIDDGCIVYKSCNEGTFVNADKEVYHPSQTNPKDVDGLNLLGALVGISRENMKDFTALLPPEQGFKISNKAYSIVPKEHPIMCEIDEIDDLPVYDGAVIYSYENKTKNTIDEKSGLGILRGSKQFALAAKLKDGDMISFMLVDTLCRRVFKIDTHMKGVIALNLIFDIKLSASLISSYRFSRLVFENINNQNIGNNNE